MGEEKVETARQHLHFVTTSQVSEDRRTIDCHSEQIRCYEVLVVIMKFIQKRNMYASVISMARNKQRCRF